MMGRMRDLVALHGFTQTGASWRPVAARARERYRVRAPDLRGHGTASDRRPASFDAVLEDVAGLVPGDFTLAGYSMGGRIALTFALARPERVERLVLIGASPGIADPDEREARCRADEALAAEIEHDGVEAFARRWGAQELFAGQPPAVAQVAHEDRLRNSAAGLAAALRGLGTGVMPPLWERLGELPMPVTVVVGERDARFRVIGERMARRIPRGELHVLAGASHAAHLERPAKVAALL